MMEEETSSWNVLMTQLRSSSRPTSRPCSNCPDKESKTSSIAGPACVAKFAGKCHQVHTREGHNQSYDCKEGAWTVGSSAIPPAPTRPAIGNVATKYRPDLRYT